MEDESSSDIQKCLSDGQMETDEGPLINENSNGLSHLLTEGEFNSVDAAVDESSTSNQGFLNAVELSGGSVGDYLENHSSGFNASSFDVGDNAVTFPSDSLNTVLSEGNSLLSDAISKPVSVSDTDGDVADKLKMDTDFDVSESEASSQLPAEDSIHKTNIDCNLDDNNDSTSLFNDEKSEKYPDEEMSNLENDHASPEHSETIPELHNEESISIREIKETELHNDEPTIPEIKETDLHNDEPTIPEIKESELHNDEPTIPEIKESELHNDEPTIPEIKETESDNDEPTISEIKETELHNDEPTISEIKETELQNDELTISEIKETELDNNEPISIPEIQSDQPATEDKLEEAESKVETDDKEADKDTEKVTEPEIPSSEDNITEENGEANIVKVGGAEETEVVSEDELPEVQKPSVKDAENVSDDELPGPKPAELPADTEVVSEDELPASKKESRKRKPDEEGDGYDPGSPTSESESSSKKQAVTKNGESKPVPAEKRSSTEEKPKKKALPELDKYWKVVNDDPTDFTGWTYLLQYVDQESDVEAAREAYDAFLSHYPYCYGYWRKYADYEKRKGSKKKCLEVLERGLKAIPLSVDLWIHYLNHIKTMKPEDLPYIRAQYERAIEACGLEFRSDRLWESYIKWEAENGSALNVTNIYDRLLATPTLGYTTHFDNFQEHVMSEPVTGVVGRPELVKLRGEVREATGTQPQLDLPPGEDEPQDHVASEEEAQAIKERIIAARRKVHKTTGEQVAARWTFEEGIKRPYFHVKPLERCQLKNWKSYLEWEKQHGTLKRALILHERCLIACALYEEFWLRLIKFLEERIESNPELVATEREVMERACTVHHLDKPELHLHWAQFEEAQGNSAKAAEILDRIEKACPTLVQIQYRRVNIERRRGDYDKCCQLYEGYISAAKSKAIASALAIKYARFLFHVRQQPDAARKVLDEAIGKDPLNHRLHMQRLDLALHTPDTPYEVLDELVQSYERQEGADADVSASMAWRRRELAEELGPASAARAATHHARARAKHLRKRARKEKHDQPPPPSADPSKKKDSTAAATNATNNSYYQAPAATTQSYEQSYAQPYQPPWGYGQTGAPYQHPHHAGWPQYPNYY